jgi:hypothetical protein
MAAFTGGQQDTAKPDPDLAAVDGAMDRAAADAHRDHRHDAFRAETARLLLVAIVGQGMRGAEAVRVAVEATDALIAALEGRH